MALGLPDVLFAAFFAFNEINKVLDLLFEGLCVRSFSLVEVKV